MAGVTHYVIFGIPVIRRFVSPGVRSLKLITITLSKTESLSTSTAFEFQTRNVSRALTSLCWLPSEVFPKYGNILDIIKNNSIPPAYPHEQILGFLFSPRQTSQD